MNMLLRPPSLSAEEFEQLPDNKGFELIDGQLREKGMGAQSSEIQSELNFLLRLWARETRLGRVYDAECMYRCFPAHPERIRKPDVSFVRHDRIPGGRSPTGVFEVRPDFVTEVVSPSDTVYDLNEKTADYLDAAIPLIWVVYPDIRAVVVHQPGAELRHVTADEVLSGGTVLPGFSVRVADLFPPPAQT